MEKDKLRPVMYKPWNWDPKARKGEYGPEQRGFFHGWFNGPDDSYAIIENMDGTMATTGYQAMRFTDRDGGGDVK